MLTIVLSLLICLAHTQACCDGVVCNNASRCFCNQATLVPQCMTLISETDTEFLIDQNPKGYYFIPSVNLYTSIVLTICFDQEQPQQTLATYVTLSKQNMTYPNTMFNYSQTPVSYGCSSGKLNDFYFKSLAHGGLQNLIILINTTASQTSGTISLTIESAYQNNSTFIAVAIGVGCMVGVCLIGILALMLYRSWKTFRVQPQRVPSYISGGQKRSPSKHFDEAMPVVPYSQTKIKNPDQDINCIVCLVDISGDDLVRRPPCGHVFHHKCLQQWYLKTQNCPLCRSPLDSKSLQQHCSVVKNSLHMDGDMHSNMEIADSLRVARNTR